MATLSKIRFAQLISYIQMCMGNKEFSTYELEHIDEILTADPEAVKVGSDLTSLKVHSAFCSIGRAMGNGQYIEAIKQYRSLTGLGLKEAKDAIDLFPRKYT